MAVSPATLEKVRAAKSVIAESNADALEIAEMLMEIAMDIQQKPKSPDDILQAVALYDQALAQCGEKEHSLFASRILARRATALMTIPTEDAEHLLRARQDMEQVIEILAREGSEEEVAEAEMNLGLILQNLASMNKARITDSISAYQRALRKFDGTKFPAEYAILQNNLATAFLSIPFSDERAKMREALAVQAFEEGLKVVNIIDYPSEYAMLQNNLGNALQYASSSHPVENGFRALEAYDEALRVRTPKDTPSEYANTFANKANCLVNLPDDIENPQAGNREKINQAITLYREACGIFLETGEVDKVEIIENALQEIEELAQMPNPSQPVLN